MLSYYLTAAISFTFGFVAAAAFIAGRRAQSGRERAWLADEVAKFAAKCRLAASDDELIVPRADLERLQAAAEPDNRRR